MSETDLEWCLIADGLTPTELTELCSGVRKLSGQNVAVLPEPRFPVCEVKVLDPGKIEIGSLIADEMRPGMPVEMKDYFRPEPGTLLVPSLALRLSNHLTRAVRYVALVQAVRSNRAIAFIGSGLSKEVGYPDWTQLLQKLVEATELGRPSDEDLAAGGEYALSIAQQCKAKSQAKYFEVLSDEFAEKVGGYSTVHIELLKMPFASYMTTNFDPCLDLAAEHVADQRIQVWPTFSSMHISGHDIFYLHGKVPRPGHPGVLKQIRLTTDDYKQAYEDTPYISDLLSLAVGQGYVLVFIGYGLREPAITALIKAAWKQRKEMAEQVREFGVAIDTGQPHFALLPEGAAEPGELADLLRDCNINAIEFPLRDGSFQELRRLLSDLFRRTAGAGVPAIRFPFGVSVIDQAGDLK